MRAAEKAGRDVHEPAAALAATVAALIGEAVDLQRLSHGADCSTAEMLLGDLHLASAAAMLPNLKRPAVEAQFATALMQAALGLEYRSLLQSAVADTIAGAARNDGSDSRRPVLVQLGGLDESNGLDDLEKIDAQLLRIWVDDPIDVRRPFGSLITAGGKRIRARLALLSSRLGPRHDESRALTLAAAVELVHNASLVHDDLVDSSTTRRGKPTVHTVYGPAAALRTGVYYCGRAYRLLVDLDSPAATASVMQALSRLGQGEIDEFQMRGDSTVTTAQYLQVVSNKTAALTEAACAAGAAISAADTATTLALKSYGRALGIALQIVDDVLDFSPQSGKTVGLDVAQSVSSLPIILALNSPQTAANLRRLLAEPPVPTDRVSEMLASTGAFDAAMRLARRYRDRALSRLSRLPAGPALDDLAQIANFTVERSC